VLFAPISVAVNQLHARVKKHGWKPDEFRVYYENPKLKKMATRKRDLSRISSRV